MLLFGIGLIACEGPKTSYTGHNTYEYMPLNGERDWRYKNGAVGDEIPEEQFELNVEKFSTTEKDNYEVVTLEYSEADPRVVLGSIQWSSDSRNGIAIHGYSDTQEEVVFETPVVISTYRMIPGEANATTTNESTFTSTLVGVEECENHWYPGDQAWSCLHFTIESDDGEGIPFVGDWWLATTWGASRFEIPNGFFGSSNPWVLSQSSHEND